MRALSWNVILLTFIFGTTQGAPEELRGVRLELPALYTVATPEQIVENVTSVGLNTLMCTVKLEEAEDPRFKQLLGLAHSRGLEVHAVLSAMVPGGTGPSPQSNPVTHAVDSSGRLSSEWLCPSRQIVRDWAVVLATAMARLGVDGLQLDYIRFGGPDLCHCDLCKRESRKWLSSRADRTWEDWRDSVIASFVGMVREAVKAANPRIVFSCSTWTVGEGQRRTYLTPEGEGYGWRQGQNFGQLAALTDFLRPMLYSCMLRQDSAWIERMARLAVKNAAGKSRIVVGVALTIEEEWKACRVPAGDLSGIVEGIRAAGAHGIALFSYSSLFDPKYAHLGYREEVKRVFH